MGYNIEKVYEIWNNEYGDRIEVRPDRDGLECVEIIDKEPDGTIRSKIILIIEQARLVATAIESCAYDIKGRR